MTAPATLIDALANAFNDALRVPGGVAANAALLWTDPDSQWRGVIESLRNSVPTLFSLGAFAPTERQGPAIWLRCIVDRSLPQPKLPDDATPILYLPGVSRQILRAAGDCPPALQPLIELQFRGTVFHQRNGRDWTVEAFLGSEAVGLEIAADQRTREALRRSLTPLAVEPLAHLRARRLEAEDFDRLLLGDPIRDLLAWMNDVEGARARFDNNAWETFRLHCREKLEFDPSADGPETAASKLMRGGGRWDEVWRRFAEAPQAYPGLVKQLKSPGASPQDLAAPADRQPGVNERNEVDLEDQFEQILKFPHEKACARILELNERHRDRLNWVWTRLGESPYAVALDALVRLAKGATTPLAGAGLRAAVSAYTEHGWTCDSAALAALDSVRGSKQFGLVARVVRALYLPWLDSSVRHFQAQVSNAGSEILSLVIPPKAEPGVCILFADGLRFDVGSGLQTVLEARGLKAQLGHRLTALPTVTATAKPVASPVAAACRGSDAGEDFVPVLTSGNQAVTAQRLRDQMTSQGIQVLVDDVASPIPGNAGGWIEIGKIDEYGHKLEPMLFVRHIPDEIDRIADAAVALLEAGWSRVRIVTDHGWLLLPGNLPKVDLPKHLVGTKWSRCAISHGAVPEGFVAMPWYWNPAVTIVSPPGAAAFAASTPYSHGGISPQECITPELIIERVDLAISSRISAVSWRGLRCRVSVSNPIVGLRIDLRRKLRQPDNLAASKIVETDGTASLIVGDDAHEGLAANVVLLGADGAVLDSKPTTVGETQ